MTSDGKYKRNKRCSVTIKEAVLVNVSLVRSCVNRLHHFYSRNNLILRKSMATVKYSTNLNDGNNAVKDEDPNFCVKKDDQGDDPTISRPNLEDDEVKEKGKYEVDTKNPKPVSGFNKFSCWFGFIR